MGVSLRMLFDLLIEFVLEVSTDYKIPCPWGSHFYIILDSIFFLISHLIIDDRISESGKQAELPGYGDYLHI